MKAVATKPDQSMLSPFSWQLDHWRRLGEQWSAGRCPHALLLCGQAGVGKRHFMQAFAALLMCDQPLDGLACGDCRSCQLRVAASHPDFVEIVPEQAGGPLKVAQIRQLGDFVAQTSARGGVRLVCLAPAESMNINAANALLKNLEEPPNSVVFLLLSDNPAQLLPTIRSRCQMIAFATPTQQVALHWLSEHGVNGVAAQRALALAGGAPLLAATLAELQVEEIRQKFLTDLTTLTQTNANTVVLAGRWEASSTDLNNLLQYWQSWLIQMLKVRSSDQSDDEQIVRLLQRLPGKGMFSLRPLFTFYDQLLQARQALSAGANPNRRLLVEELMIRWANIFI
ncbi:MAG: DNA polymerase III subunit delta' [Gammaproteobacteria bacterium]|nr:DNA polymerase III subunit delta' [Gammaproteobacteria bacterium]